jgi:signal peptidase I
LEQKEFENTSGLEDEDEEIISEEEKKKQDREKRKERSSFVGELLIYVAIVVVCLFFVPKYVVQRTVVSGTSMENTLQDEDNLIVEKVSYRFSDPKRFDIIVFYPFGRENEEYYVKRIIGLPGETIQIIGDDIYINGELLEENYGKDPMTNSGIAETPLTLADDEYFVLGDNRKISQDSRYEEVGPVKRDLIEGKVVLRIYPFDKFGLVSGEPTASADSSEDEGLVLSLE